MTSHRHSAGVAAWLTERDWSWKTAAFFLAVGFIALGLTYAPEADAAVRVWVASTAFNHCFLILPIAAYLLYQRWDAVVAAEPQPMPLIAVVAVPIGVAWLVVERAGIMEGRQLFAMVLLQILVMATLGYQTWRVLSAPLLYLFFLVPMGEYAIPWLQIFTVHFISQGLNLLGIPRFVDGVAIEIPEGRFLVADACAGLRFVIASVAFGTFYACLIYVSPVRRLLFIAVALVVPVLANGCRALATVVLGHELGSAEAAAVDHLLYGWLFFTVVLSLLILAGLPFRQPARPVPPIRVPERPARPAAAAIAVIVVVTSGALPRLTADRFDRSAATAFAAAPIALPAPNGCVLSDPPATALPLSPEAPGATLSRNYSCGGDQLVFHLYVFPPKSGAGPIFAALRGAAIAPGWDGVAADQLTVGEGGRAQTIWRVTTMEQQGRFAAVAAALWINGQSSEAGIASRLRQAFAALQGGGAPPVVATVATAAQNTTPGAARAALARFLVDAIGISDAIAKSSGRARR